MSEHDVEAMTEYNRFNVIYHNLPEDKQKLIRDMKGTAALLATMIGQNPNRASSIAMTELETCIMWAVKGVCVGHESY
jgi:hypothetical protein